MEALKLHELYKIYKEGDIEIVALKGANLSVKTGEFVAITGRSGAGKSTLLNIIGGLTIPSAGKVFIDGSDITKMSEAERSVLRQETIGIIYQTDNLIPFLTAAENVMLPMQLSGKKNVAKKAHDLLSEVGLHERLHHKPGMLSGGERQRVAIAVALANEPRLLLADELTGELDTKTSNQVMEMLHDINLKQKLTLVVVTHNKKVAARANKQIQIFDGQLLDNKNKSGNLNDE